MNASNRPLIATLIGAVALMAAMWFLAISPKRSEGAEVSHRLVTQQARLDAADAQVVTYTASHKQFDGLLVELRRLDMAVPARAAVSSMLRELQRRAKVRGSDLRLVALKSGGAAAPATEGATGTPLTPGAVAGPGELSALPFTFEYTGKYLDLVDILATIRRSVRTEDGDVTVSGRLLTVDGLAFKRVTDSALTKATVNATAYIAPDPAAAPQPPADAGQPPAKEGS